MKVSELITKLQTMPQDMEVLLSGQFEPAAAVCKATYPDEDDKGNPIDTEVVLICEEGCGE